MSNNFWTKHGSTVMTAGSCVSIAASGYFFTKFGMVLEQEKPYLKDEDPMRRKAAKLRIAIAGAEGVISGIAAIGLTIGARVTDKNTIAGLASALGVQTKLFNDYRALNDPCKDKEIMTDIAVKNKEVPENKSKDPNLEWWTDDFIEELSDKKVKGYWASESDILRCALYMKDTYYNECFTSIGTFYSKLRECGVDIPEFKGENGIIWEQTSERIDFSGTYYIDFDWYDREDENGNTIHALIFSETDDEIYEENRKLEWFLKKKNDQDLLDYIQNENALK